jgi:hypothetical protein
MPSIVPRIFRLLQTAALICRRLSTDSSIDFSDSSIDLPLALCRFTGQLKLEASNRQMFWSKKQPTKKRTSAVVTFQKR